MKTNIQVNEFKVSKIIKLVNPGCYWLDSVLIFVEEQRFRLVVNKEFNVITHQVFDDLIEAKTAFHSLFGKRSRPDEEGINPRWSRPLSIGLSH